MKVICMYCVKAGEPALIREKEPLDDPRITHGICHRHLVQLHKDMQALGLPLRAGQRRFARLPVSIPATGRAPQVTEKVLNGVVRSVGSGGILVEFRQEIPVGSLMHVVLQARRGPVEIECRVAWITRAGGGIHHGLAFLTPQGPDFAESLFLDSDRQIMPQG
ncbi:MAG TPA: PilZ domain-containing protein [Candidatus Methylomirabilis sp.]|nr:PilZ domain-containing protein [Candidatus Methylomirabilis sp.]